MKTGIGFNFKHIRENNKEIWNKYREVLVEGFPAVESMEIVYINELSRYIDGKVLLALLEDLLPREFIEDSRKL